MGINGLLPYVKRFVKRSNLREFCGKRRAAIDASCWLHKALCVSIRRDGSRETGKSTDQKIAFAKVL